MDDVILNKIAIIERCIVRIKEVYDNNPENLADYTKQDSIILNLQRAIEASIDLAMHLVSVRKLGIPQSSREAFEILSNDNLIEKELRDKLSSMVGFRNIAVHNYQDIELEIIKNIIENHINDFEEFKQRMLKYV